MDLSTLNTQSLSRYAGVKINCGCGVCHTVNTQSIVFGAGALADLASFIAPFLPQLGVVTLVSDTQIREKTNRAFEKQLARLSYRVHTHTYNLPLEASASNVNELKIPEEAKLILGVGGGTVADITKYIAAAKKLPCAFILTSPCGLGVLSPSAAIKTDGVEETFKTPPFSAVFCDTDFFKDLPPELLPSGFGALAAKAVSLLDYKFAHLVGGERFCPYIHELGYAAIDEMLARFRDGDAVTDKGAAAFVAESALRFSALAQFTGNSRLFSGGEAQAAYALGLLFTREERPLKLRGATEFVIARIVLEIYKNFLSDKRIFFSPPPSNNIRAEKITEYFGISERAVMNKIRAVPDPEKLKFHAYRLNEYRDELYEEACLNVARLNRAWRIFKRLYPDDGFGLLNYIEPPDAAVSIALAPDLKEKFTLLSYMKDAGLLDEQIRG